MGGQGQEFHPEVVVQTTGFSLDCGKSFLENRDGNLYSGHPIQGCTSLGGNQYRFYFNTPMKAPGSPGEYHSKWQVWNGSAHIGPQVDIWFRVATPPANNRPPDRPVGQSPGDLSEIRSVTAPELCWSPASDPDGDSVQYFAEVFESAHIASSGWISGTCWRPSSLDGQYFGYQWHVKAKDSRDAESGWSDRLRFTLSPPEYDPPQPTSTPRAVPTQPTASGAWWDTAYAYRRLMPITTADTLPAGTLIKVDGLDLNALVAQSKARADRNDIRVVRRLSPTTWQEVARVVYTEWDLEFQLLADIPPGTDASYYVYYGNPGAGAPPSFSLPQGWWVDLYLDKWWSSYKGTWAHDQAMDFGDVCEPPISHRDRTGGSAFDDSDKFRGRLFIPTTGRWTFNVYTNDGYALYLDGAEIGRFDGYETNRWATIGTVDNLKAGWYTFDLRNMWVNCGAWKFAMSGPGFNQIVPANFFQRVWDNVRSGIVPGFEETQSNPFTPTPTYTATPTATPSAPTAPSFAGDGRDGDLTVTAGQVFAPNSIRASVSAANTQASVATSSGFSVGDTVLFHQTQGTANVGSWEISQIAAINGANWTLARPLNYAYDSTSGHAQVLKVPQYRYMTIQAGGTLIAPAWDGSTGGILALMCNGVCTVTGKVDINRIGFRGGAAYNIANTVQYQGEGTGGPGGLSQAANGNGGGGGHSEYPVQAWTGGAGGGHSAPGGNATGRNGSPTSFGGTSAGTPDLSSAVFGGGGGGYTQQSGGGGGGIGFFFVNALTLNGSITANGANGTPQGGESSGSGGGAGGALLIRAKSMQSSGALAVDGGAGGASGPQYGTPGGNGSAGRVRIEYCVSIAGAMPPAASIQQINCPASSTPTATSTATASPSPTAISTSTTPASPTATSTPTETPTPTATSTPVPTPWWLGDGRDGAMPTSGNLDNNNGFGLGTVNGSAGSTLIAVEDRYAVWRINPGDYVLIQQTRGANAGSWELNRAASDISGSGTFALANPLQHTYTTSSYQNQAQIVRVPQYATCNVTGTVTPLTAWNGTIGGIFAVMCQGTLSVSGAISTDGYGFRGGRSGNGYQTDQWQGESIASPGNDPTYYYQRPDQFPSAQGGGAADQIGGGGGGGGYSTGGDGDHIGGSRWGQGGIGYGTPDLSLMFFGGGGGGGATSISPGTGYSQSGNGGGLIYIFASGVSVSGQITARGQQASGVMYDDGTNRRVTAGSGGGGQIFIRIVSGDLGANRVDATGGAQLVPPPGGTGRFGGGAGGQGYIRVEQCSTVSGSTTPPLSAQSISCP